MSVIHLIIFVITSGLLAEAGRILVVVPTPSISHQVVFRPLTQELAKRGHEVTVITTDPVFPKGQSPANLTEIDLHDLSYKMWRDTIAQHSAKHMNGNPTDSFGQLDLLMTLFTKIFEMQMMTDDVKNVINNKKYDLLIIESCVQAALALTHIYKVPVISMSSFGGFPILYDTLGAPNRPPLLYPTTIRHKLVNMSRWDKITDLLKHYWFETFLDSVIKKDDEIVKKLFGLDFPSIVDLYNNIDMLFLNVHPIWELNRPVPPNIVYMGGMHQKPIKELPKELKAYLDSSKNGVIYISYGTNVDTSMLPPEKVQTLVQAFSELPYDVLWKWNEDELPNQPPNVKISKWLPQSDLLKHPKIKLFITQGGLQSTDEAITAGVPLIGMPMLGDQWYNVEMYVYHKIGLRLDMVDVTKESFKQAINTITNDDSYRKNIERLRSVMNDQPQKPLDRAVWWTEHLLRHGRADHLKAPAAHMSWSEYLDLDLFIPLGLSALALLIAIGYTVNYLYKLITTKVLSSEKLKKN